MNITEYKEEFGVPVFPEGFEQTLEGLSLDEQLERLRTTGSDEYTITGWSSRTVRYGCRRLDQDHNVRSIIVRGGMIVGAMMTDHSGRTVPCLPEQCVCTYYSEDNNGAGYKIRQCFRWLICVSENFDGAEGAKE